MGKNRTNWQPAFIRYNFPVIGYLAWKGFKQIMLMTHVGKSIEAFWLKNLAISSPECYRQVCD